MVEIRRCAGPSCTFLDKSRNRAVALMLSCQEGFQLFGDDAVEDGCFGISAGISVEQFKKEAMSRVPLGEMVEPEEVANLVAFLTAEAGGKITAQAISICGGSTQA